MLPPALIDVISALFTLWARPIPKVMQDHCAQNRQSTRTGDTACNGFHHRVQRGLRNPRNTGAAAHAHPVVVKITDLMQRDAHQARLPMRLGPLAESLARAGNGCGSWLKAF